jgi:hypothetical protein
MGGVNKLDSLAARLAGEANPSVIRAYHGSPYDFDRFDASKIGTGEGMASYGYGHNFASRKPVAEYYRDSLKDMLDSEPPGDLFADEADARRIWSEESQKARGVAAGQPNPHLAAAEDAFARAMQARKEIEAYQNPGRVYEVEIAHPAHSLLDWDRSLADQQHLLPQVERAINKIADPEARYDNMLAIEDPKSFKGKEVYGVLRNSLGGDVAASRALLDSGVPGMRYLDGPSRSSAVLIDAGSRNTLMFPGTEDSIRILRKYAVPGAVGTGVASQYEEER